MVPPSILTILSPKAKRLAKPNELAVKGTAMGQNKIPGVIVAGLSPFPRREHPEAHAFYPWSVCVWHVMWSLLTGCVRAGLTQRNWSGRAQARPYLAGSREEGTQLRTIAELCSAPAGGTTVPKSRRVRWLSPEPYGLGRGVACRVSKIKSAGCV
jgi:hypothetical protein